MNFQKLWKAFENKLYTLTGIITMTKPFHSGKPEQKNTSRVCMLLANGKYG